MVCCWTAKIHNLELGVPSWSEETWIPSWVPLHWRMIKKHGNMLPCICRFTKPNASCVVALWICMYIYIYLWHIIDWMIFPWKIVMFHSCLYVYQEGKPYVPILYHFHYFLISKWNHILPTNSKYQWYPYNVTSHLPAISPYYTIYYHIISGYTIYFHILYPLAIEHSHGKIHHF